jgi:hypothetical protein
MPAADVAALERCFPAPQLQLDTKAYLMQQCSVLSCILGMNHGAVMMASDIFVCPGMRLSRPHPLLPEGLLRYLGWMRPQVLRPELQFLAFDIAPIQTMPSEEMLRTMRTMNFDQTWRTSHGAVFQNSFFGHPDDEIWSYFLTASADARWKPIELFFRNRGPRALLDVSNIVSYFNPTLDHSSVRLLPIVEMGLSVVQRQSVLALQNVAAVLNMCAYLPPAPVAFHDLLKVGPTFGPAAGVVF